MTDNAPLRVRIHDRNGIGTYEGELTHVVPFADGTRHIHVIQPDNGDLIYLEAGTMASSWVGGPPYCEVWSTWESEDGEWVPYTKWDHTMAAILGVPPTTGPGMHEGDSA